MSHSASSLFQIHIFRFEQLLPSFIRQKIIQSLQENPYLTSSEHNAPSSKPFSRNPHDKVCKCTNKSPSQAFRRSTWSSPKKQIGQGDMSQKRSKDVKIWKLVSVTRKIQPKTMKENDLKNCAERYLLSHLKSGVSIDTLKLKGNVNQKSKMLSQGTQQISPTLKGTKTRGKLCLKTFTYKLDQVSIEEMMGCQHCLVSCRSYAEENTLTHSWLLSPTGCNWRACSSKHALTRLGNIPERGDEGTNDVIEGVIPYGDEINTFCRRKSQISYENKTMQSRRRPTLDSSALQCADETTQNISNVRTQNKGHFYIITQSDKNGTKI